jgi:hypothetical protein
MLIQYEFSSGLARICKLKYPVKKLPAPSQPRQPTVRAKQRRFGGNRICLDPVPFPGPIHRMAGRGREIGGDKNTGGGFMSRHAR